MIRDTDRENVHRVSFFNRLSVSFNHRFPSFKIKSNLGSNFKSLLIIDIHPCSSESELKKRKLNVILYICNLQKRGRKKMGKRSTEDSILEHSIQLPKLTNSMHHFHSIYITIIVICYLNKHRLLLHPLAISSKLSSTTRYFQITILLIVTQFR